MTEEIEFSFSGKNVKEEIWQVATAGYCPKSVYEVADCEYSPVKNISTLNFSDSHCPTFL
jgi:hypothetical protein